MNQSFHSQNQLNLFLVFFAICQKRGAYIDMYYMQTPIGDTKSKRNANSKNCDYP